MSESNHPGEPQSHSQYWLDVEAEDRRLDQRLRDIRRRYDSGMITVRAAAEMRIEALESHLSEITRLREQWLGGR